MPTLCEIKTTDWLRGIAMPLIGAILNESESLPDAAFDILPLAYQSGEGADRANEIFRRLCEKPYEGDALAPYSYVKPRAAMRYYSISHADAALRYITTYLARQMKALNEKRKIPALTLMQYGEIVSLCLFSYEETKKPQLLALAERWIKIGFDYSSYFNAFPHTEPMRRAMPPEQTARILAGINDMQYSSASEIDVYTQNTLTARGDIAAMGLRASAYRCIISGMKKDSDAAELGYAKLMKHHGAAITFTSDMHLAGREPSRLIWINAACETIRSLLDIVRINPMSASAGDLMDAAERIAVNLLPSAVRDGFVQEAQRVNQISCVYDRRAAYSLDGTAVMYKKISAQIETAAAIAGALSHFASNAWLVADGALILNFPVASVKTSFVGISFAAELETDYPLGCNTKLAITVSSQLRLDLLVRIPGFSRKTRIIRVNGELIEDTHNSYAVISREWHTGDVVEIMFPNELRLEKTGASSASYFAGPVLLALPLTEKQSLSPDGSSMELTSDDKWAYGIRGDSAPTKLGDALYETEAFEVPSWNAKHAIAEAPPHISRRVADAGKAEKIKLVPYGRTMLRVAQFPCLETEKLKRGE
ncbi:MAG: glycoside hydrolase family 127 protein [Oscillospiraceae bacterium]|nr:glycoside hydrolase family 127 protein [Oscillospiraceae bacterium]